MAVMTALAIGALVAGTAVKARAAHKAGSEQARAALEAQKNAEFNQAAAKDQAVDASRRGGEDENMYRRDVRARQGSQRAGYGAQGVDVSMGSPAAVNASAAGLGQSDIVRIRRNAEREALGYKNVAENYGAEARNAALTAKAAKSNARNAVIGTILGGAADVSLLASRQGWGNDAPPKTGAGSGTSRETFYTQGAPAGAAPNSSWETFRKRGE